MVRWSDGQYSAILFTTVLVWRQLLRNNPVFLFVFVFFSFSFFLPESLRVVLTYLAFGTLNSPGVKTGIINAAMVAKESLVDDN